jgi:hypothetical protein
MLQITTCNPRIRVVVLAVMVTFSYVSSGCKKYLEAKPDQTIATPSTIEDLEGILNNYAFINARYPSAAEVCADNYYLKPADLSAVLEVQRNFYTWQKYDLIGGDYASPYSSIEYANIILDALPKIADIHDNRSNTVKGNAMFIRAAYHLALAQLFCKPYKNASAPSDLGIALRLSSDVALRPVRSTVAETYASIINDLKRASGLLPAQADVKYHAGKAAAFGVLARTFLSMSDYNAAGLYADSALNLYNKLIDYNSVNKTSTIPFAQFNDEVIYDSRSAAPQALAASRAKVDTTLYRSFGANDLRKAVFFKTNTDGSFAFKGNYTGQNNASIFTGVATDELYLIKAECAARNGNIKEALTTVNNLLIMRWKSGTYIPMNISDKDQLLAAVLIERRKELIFRNLRWTDLRRLNLEPESGKTIIRNVNGTVYSLPPQSDRYVLQLDRSTIDISGLQQNP